jgi:hypothetical protein
MIIENEAMNGSGAHVLHEEHSSAISDLQRDVRALKVDVKSLRETQDTQLAILERLDKVANNPMLRRVLWAVGTAMLSYLASKGWSVK